MFCSIRTTENLLSLTITTRPSGNLNIVEGNTFTVTCTVEGGIPSTLDWYRNGVKLTENGSIGLSHTNQNSVALTLRNVTSSDNGDRTCVATTTAGDTIRANITVNVLSKLYFISVSKHVFG